MKKLVNILERDNGSLPDIEFDYAGKPLASEAYLFVQSKATRIVSANPYYWSISKQKECLIQYGNNPALKYLQGEAEPFHVVFGGLKSNSGNSIPDLGFFVLGVDFISLDYRMGSEWNIQATEGLIEPKVVDL